MLEEKTSKHLGIPYVYLPEVKKFLCQNGVIFTLEEYKKGININSEYEKRSKEGTLYDYNYAKATGVLRKKRAEKNIKDTSKDVQSSRNTDTVRSKSEFKDTNTSTERVRKSPTETKSLQGNNSDRRNESNTDRQKEKQGVSILFIIVLLAITSVISMYVSTLHTATYLKDYADIFSAWLMSASVTAYNTTAFEVSVLFHNAKRNFMAVIFMLLWVFVTVFSMATTVSVFYDQFNFQEAQIAEENKGLDSNKLALELLQKKEKDLREAIEFKKKDIEYRQEREWATSAVRAELNRLENQLQSNLDSQQKIIEATPEATKDKVVRKETLFAFLGRIWKMEGGILEFIMSTLSAIFVNIISPLSLTAVIELSKKKLTK